MAPSTNTSFGYPQLSLKDLIEARDLFHIHFMNKKNVVATALGRYRIRKGDPFPNEKNYTELAAENRRKNKIKTLGNTEVRDYSWPCILVFVSQWEDKRELVNGERTGSDIIPPQVYMPDGRIIPVCVVQAETAQVTDTTVPTASLVFPTNIISGGFPLLVESQGQERIASIGCVVTDGNKYYALTNRHVTGEPGTEIYTLLHRSRTRIGVTAQKEIGKGQFTTMYPGWLGRTTMVNVDVGLIEIEDINLWKTEVVGIGTIDEMVDLNTANFSLNLISVTQYEGKTAKPPKAIVTAYGAVSGKMEGEIAALFYRYRSTGGLEYVSDFLIGGVNGKPLNTHFGDSGTLWMLTTTEGTREMHQPIALQWGQHEFIGSNGTEKNTFALATCLSNICRDLDVDIVRGWNLDVENTWGKVGHYTIGNLATTGLTEPLKALMTSNLTNISFKEEDITPAWDARSKKTKQHYKDMFAEFCPLSDVPDIIWKDSPRQTTWGRRGIENPNHFMDADIPMLTTGRTFLDTVNSPTDLSVATVKNYYQNLDLSAVGIRDRSRVQEGILPLRVWQVYDYMVEAANAKKLEQFIFGAGILAHYVGDACQPLHSSYFADGDPADDTTETYTPTRGGTRHMAGMPYQRAFNPGNGVHVAYEDIMIDKISEKGLLFKGIKTDITTGKVTALARRITSGQEAGFAVIELIKKVHLLIRPKDIVETYKRVRGANPDTIAETLWGTFGGKTIECMTLGCECLAALWTAAWTQGGSPTNGKALNYATEDFRKKLKSLYLDPTQLESHTLTTIGSVLRFPAHIPQKQVEIGRTISLGGVRTKKPVTK